MSHTRFVSPYLKSGGDAARLFNRTRHIATHLGMEVFRDGHSKQPVTKRQQAYIQHLLRDFHGTDELLEHEDRHNAPTQGNASAFTRQVQEDSTEPTSRMENYPDYVSHHPGVQLNGGHGLWRAGGKVCSLSQAAREVAEHTGNAWAPVMAIRREDVERLGYSDADS